MRYHNFHLFAIDRLILLLILDASSSPANDLEHVSPTFSTQRDFSSTRPTGRLRFSPWQFEKTQNTDSNQTTLHFTHMFLILAALPWWSASQKTPDCMPIHRATDNQKINNIFYSRKVTHAVSGQRNRSHSWTGKTTKSDTFRVLSTT